MLVDFTKIQTQEKLHLAVTQDGPRKFSFTFNSCRNGRTEQDTANHEDASKRFPLHFISQIQNPDEALAIGRFLLTKGAKPNSGDDNSHTPLHLSAQKGQSKVCALMLQNAGNANQGDNDGYTPVHAACYSGDLETIQIFKPHANFQQGDNEGNNPLHYAVMGGSLEVTRFLMNEGISPDIGNSKSITPIHIAATSNNIAIMTEFMDPGVGIMQGDDAGDTPLHFAAKLGHLEIIRLFANKGDVINQGNKESWTALHFAAHHGHVEAAKALVLIGADLNQGTKAGFAPTHAAAKLGHANVLKAMHEASNGSISYYGEKPTGLTPLHYACMNGHLDAAYLLRTYASDILEKQDKKGLTAFDYACQFGHLQVVAMMLDKGANTTEKSLSESLKFQGDIEVTKLLLDNDVMPTSNDLDVAVSTGNLDKVTLLLKYRASIDGEALSLASKQSLEMAQLLVRCGAKITQDIVSQAQTSGYTEIARYLSENQDKTFESELEYPELNQYVDLAGLYHINTDIM